jgi:hypothetical protein
MLDLSYFQNRENSNTQTFTNAGTWMTWIKPRNARTVEILCMGSGAGGGGGFVTGSAVARGGGGGGGTGAITLAVFQASILPDVLYVYTGVGGAGGQGGNPASAGTPGEKSYVCISPDTSSASNIVITSGNVSARAGTGGTTAGGGGGNGETAATIANATFLGMASFTSNAGGAGGGGAATGVGNANITSIAIAMRGAGGAGNAAGNTTPQNGSGFNASGFYPSVLGGTGNGRDGLILYKPILAFMAGNGGGSGGAGAGGNGGNGAYGSGGGGGGAGVTTGGTGGKGGDGLVIITTSL